VTATSVPAVFEAALERGIAGGLSVLYADASRIHVGGAGYAIVPRAVPAAATATCAGTPLTAPAPPLPLLSGAAAPDLAVIRCPGDGPEAAGCCGNFAYGIAWLRLGLSRALLSTVVAFARDRTVAGGSLLNQQLVKGALADSLAELMTAEATLAGGPPDPAGLPEFHHAVTVVDRSLLRLLGAEGFRRDGPGGVSHLSELLAELYGGTRRAGA